MRKMRKIFIAHQKLPPFQLPFEITWIVAELLHMYSDFVLLVVQHITSEIMYCKIDFGPFDGFSSARSDFNVFNSSNFH